MTVRYYVAVKLPKTKNKKTNKAKKGLKVRGGGGASAKETKNISEMRVKIQCRETKQRNVRNEE